LKVTLQSTTQTTTLVDRLTGQSIPARVWEGETDSGIKVQALIPCIRALANQDLSQFERDLRQCEPPSTGMQAFPLRMIL
jgi:hypothetical protein